MKLIQRAICCSVLLFSVHGIRAATVAEILVPSAAMRKDIPVTVILPEAYRPDGAPLPVLYLLHGYSDNHRTWSTKTSIAALADQHGIIVVCPDAGFSSWYFDSPVDPAWRYETFVAGELVAHVDENYRTLPRRESRAIAGQSMGGHGAMFLAIRHSGTFSVVVCFSGGVDLRPFPGKWDIAKRLGAMEEFPERWAEHSVLTLAEKLAPGKLAIAIDCGVDDFFSGVNRELHQLLLTRQVPHDYTERPGRHDWAYWSNAIQFQMLFVAQNLAR